MLYKSVTAAVGGILLSQSIQLVAEDNSKIPEELLVTASRIEMPLRQIGSSVSALDRSDIEARGYATAQDLLRTLPGINVSTTGGVGSTATLRIRGEEGYRTRILIDGVNLDDTTSPQHSARIENILTSDIEKIEVLRGAQGMMYGADSGGVINIITRGPKEGLAAVVSHERGRYGFEQTSANVTARGDRFTVAVNMNQTDADGFNAKTIDTTQRDKDGYENRSRGVDGTFELTDHWRIKGLLRSVKSQSQYDGFNAAASHDNHTNFEQFNRQFSLERNHDRGEFRVRWQNSSAERDSFTDDVRQFGGKGASSEWQLFGAQEILSGKLLGGIDLKHDEDIANDRERDQLGAFTEWQGQMPGGTYYTLGVRHDDNDDFGSYLTHRISFAHIVDFDGGNSLRFRGSHGTGFRAPSLFEISVNATNGPALGPEETRSMDFGIEFQSGSRFRGEVIYFKQEVSDAIDAAFGPFRYVQVTGVSKSEGAELNGEFTFIEGLRFVGNATYNDAKRPDGAPRVLRPRHLRNAGIEYRSNAVPVTVFANMRFVEDSFDTGNVELDDYEVLDINVSWKLSDSIELWVRGENLLDEDYQEVNGFNTGRAAVYSGARLRFN